ncbi:MAG: asparaginase, partial [Crenarchaeota archaeon]|nr:asparaginase [Thermoproteota archaeon]
MTLAIAVHGGAGRWNVPDDIKERAMQVLRRSIDAGYDVLARGGTALEAVVEAVAVLEDSGVFNAGVGSVLNALGEIEMDAGLATSSGLVAAVCCVKYPRNPIRLAKLVMERTDHVLLCGEGADRLARALGLERHPGPTEFIRRRFDELRAKLDSVSYWKKLREILPILER